MITDPKKEIEHLAKRSPAVRYMLAHPYQISLIVVGFFLFAFVFDLAGGSCGWMMSDDGLCRGFLFLTGYTMQAGDCVGGVLPKNAELYWRCVAHNGLMTVGISLVVVSVARNYVKSSKQDTGNHPPS